MTQPLTTLARAEAVPARGDRVDRLLAAFEAVGASAIHDPLPQFLHVAAIELAAVADADCSALSALRDNALVDCVTYDPRGQLTAGDTYLVGEYPATRTVLTTRTTGSVHVDDPASDAAEIRLLQEFGLSAVLLLPVVSGPYTWGLAEGFRERRDPFGAEDVALARLFTAHLGSLLLPFYD